MNSSKLGDRIHSRSWKTDFPFHVDTNVNHHWMSRWDSSVMVRDADGPDTVQLKSKSCRTKVQPGGTTFAANDK